MKVILLVVLIALSSSALAENLGKFGKTYPIIETDIIEFFKKRAAQLHESGEFKSEMEGMRDRAKAYVKRPQGISLPRADVSMSSLYDSTYTLERNVVDHTGKLIYKKGTKINPLQYTTLNRKLCFIDSDDEDQIEWAKKYCLDPLKSKLILTNGDIEKAHEKLKTRIYFDQYGRLIKHFGIKYLPAVIRQIDEAIYVENYAL